MYTRKHTREWLMKVLYKMDMMELHRFSEEDLDPVIREKDKDYVKEFMSYYLEHRQEIDQRLEACLENWDLKNINKVELALLRLSALEMDYMKDIPSQVSINEALEIAKKYSSEEAPGFIHGVLGKYYRTYHE